MNHPDMTLLTKVQKFLSAIYGQIIPNIRSAADFLTAFPPSTLMLLVEHPEVRANVLHATVGTRIEIGRKASRESIAEQVQLALDEKISTPEAILQLLTPDHRAMYLDQRALWAFAVETTFWEGEEADTARVTNARNAFTVMLETALKCEMLTPEELIRAVGYSALFESESKASLIQTIEALTSAGIENRFELLLKRFTTRKMVSTVPLGVLWEKVIQPLIAVRHELFAKAASKEILTTVAESEDIHERPTTTPEEPKSRPIGSSPSATPVDLTRKVSSSALALGISAQQGPIPGARASSVPAAHRTTSSLPAPSHGGDSNDPKGGETSEASAADVEDGGDRVSESEIIDPSKDTAAQEPSVQTPSASSSLPHDITEPHIEIASKSALSIEVRKPSSTFPAVIQAPRPSSDTRPHATGSSEVQLEVGYASSMDPDVVAALEAEQTSERGVRTSYISDDAFARAGGARRGDAQVSSEEASVTSVEGKTAVCMLLRSSNIGVPLEGIDMFACRVRQVLTTALEEIDPNEYRNAGKRYNDTDGIALGNMLCLEVEKRNPIAGIQLRQMLVDLGYASKSAAPVRGRPPPLPPTKSVTPPTRRGDPTGERRR